VAHLGWPVHEAVYGQAMLFAYESGLAEAGDHDIGH
jgi:hypothetical protein